MTVLREISKDLWHGPRTAVTVIGVLVNLGAIVLLGAFAAVIVEQDQHVLSAHPECADAVAIRYSLPAGAASHIDLGEPRFAGDNTLHIPYRWSDPDAHSGCLPRSGVIHCRFGRIEDDEGKATSGVVAVEVFR